MKEGESLQQMILEQLDSHRQKKKKELWLKPHPLHTKKNPKCIIDLNMRYETIKNLNDRTESLVPRAWWRVLRHDDAKAHTKKDKINKCYFIKWEILILWKILLKG